MLEQSVLRVSERSHDFTRPAVHLRVVSGHAFPDGTSWSDCWPDNTEGGTAGSLDPESLRANSPRRVLFEFGAVLAVVALAATLANAFI